jgi:hypothetical protein
MADGLLNKASIILTPTGYKAGTLYNVAPIDEPYEDFDFARTSTATRINSSGLVSNVATGVPRISYDSNGDNGHILLEPTSTNLIPYSEDFNSGWTQYGSPTINTSSIISPDGTLNGSKITRGSNQTPLRFVNVAPLNNEYTFSVYAKKGSVDSMLLDIGDVAQVEFTLTDEWQRFTVTQTPTTYKHVDISLGTSVSGDFIYIWGAQLEALSFATSYIPTLTGSPVIRETETANGAGSADLINSTEGVLYAEIASLTSDVDSEARIVLAASGDTNNSLRLYYNTTQDTIEYKCRVGSSNVCDITYDLGDSTQFHKIACKWKQNDFALWINGVEVGTDTSGSTFSADTLNVLNFSNATTLSDFFYGKVKALAVFNEALSDSELTQLTT